MKTRITRPQPDIDGLRRFSYAPDKMDKQRTWFFVGRNEIINAIDRTVSGLQQQIDCKPMDEFDFGEQTWLIQGAPGAGKSTLLRRMREIWDGRTNAPIAFEIRLKQLSEQSMLTTFIANKVVADGSKILNTIRALEISGEIDLEQTRTKSSKCHSKQQGVLVIEDLARLYDSKLQSLLNDKFPDIAKLMKNVSKKRPVVLIVDEIQALSSESEKLLQALHIGIQGFPVVLLLAGLAWSRSRLEEAGLSRFSDDGLDHVQTLQPLETKQSAQAVRMMLSEYNVIETQRVDLAMKIAKWSSGWPQHLHQYMRVLAGELAANDGVLTAVNESTVRQIGDQKRNEYYLKRLQDKRIGVSYKLLAEVAQLIGRGGCHLSELLILLYNRGWSKSKHPSSVIPKGMDAEEFINVMIRTGVAHNVNDFITFPIPSYRNFLIDRCEEISSQVKLQTN